MVQAENVEITVCTPTYNRAHTLPRVYESLLFQSRQAFEWVVVDDGSSDRTREMVERWCTEKAFPIQYFWQPNLGKHVALNVGIAAARGELFVILDSDDVFPPWALEKASELWTSIPRPERDRYMGIGGLCAHLGEPGKLVTRPYPCDGFETTYVELSTRFGIQGDRVEFFVTEVLRQVAPYPSFPGEKFLPEALLWNRLSRQYRMLFFNTVLKYCEYLEDGLTAMSRKMPLPLRCPQGARAFFCELADMPKLMPRIQLLRAYASYVRFSLHSGVSWVRTIQEAPSWLLCTLVFPVGVAAFVRDRRRYGDA